MKILSNFQFLSLFQTETLSLTDWPKDVLLIITVLFIDCFLTFVHELFFWHYSGMQCRYSTFEQRKLARLLRVTAFCIYNIRVVYSSSWVIMRNYVMRNLSFSAEMQNCYWFTAIHKVFVNVQNSLWKWFLFSMSYFASVFWWEAKCYTMNHYHYHSEKNCSQFK